MSDGKMASVTVGCSNLAVAFHWWNFKFNYFVVVKIIIFLKLLYRTYVTVESSEYATPQFKVRVQFLKMALHRP